MCSHKTDERTQSKIRREGRCLGHSPWQTSHKPPRVLSTWTPIERASFLLKKVLAICVRCCNRGNSLDAQQPGYFWGAGRIGTLCLVKPPTRMTVLSINYTVCTNVRHSEPLSSLGSWERASLVIRTGPGDLRVQPHCKEGVRWSLSWLYPIAFPDPRLPWVRSCNLFTFTEGRVQKSVDAL